MTAYTDSCTSLCDFGGKIEIETSEMVMANTFSTSSHWRHHHIYSDFKSFDSHSFKPLIFSSKLHLHCPSLLIRLRSNSNRRSPRCLSSGPGQPSPPGDDPPRSPELAGKLSMFQDQVGIFFAVLFWTSLFFWSSAWDGGNAGGPNKGSRFRR